jgi:hypothetical protein
VTTGGGRAARPDSAAGFTLEFEDDFTGDELDRRRWLPYHLPHWSTRAAAAARYQVRGGELRLRIEADQPPWCPEFDGQARVSSLQTGLFAGPLGGTVGQHRFNPRAVVRESQQPVRLYTPRYGRFELRARAPDDPLSMVALSMIGYEDEPHRSAEICICEILGRDVRPDQVAVGMGVHPFGDPAITDDFVRVEVDLDAREFHVYAAEWAPDHVDFLVDDRPVHSVGQSPDYPMQFLVGIYELPPDGDEAAGTPRYPKEFVIDYLRAYGRSDWRRDAR